MIFKIRAILNVKEDVIRDIAILKTETLEDLHNALSNAFGFEGNEMAAFYKSNDDWIQGEEFPLFDMGDNLHPKSQMREIILENILAIENAQLESLSHTSSVIMKPVFGRPLLSVYSFSTESVKTSLKINSSQLHIK